jgi:hypothetical protein
MPEGTPFDHYLRAAGRKLRQRIRRQYFTWLIVVLVIVVQLGTSTRKLNVDLLSHLRAAFQP